jgi:hypothetical protein
VGHLSQEGALSGKSGGLNAMRDLKELTFLWMSEQFAYSILNWIIID